MIGQTTIPFVSPLAKPGPVKATNPRFVKILNKPRGTPITPVKTTNPLFTKITPVK